MEPVDWIKPRLAECGAVASGFARADRVAQPQTDLYRGWIERGCNADMAYLERYDEVRSDPRLLLEGAATVIAAAFNYYTPAGRGDGGLRWARYALGDDYHDELRRRLTTVADEITARTGHACRVCVDTAPLRERYWAQCAGVGFVGLNNLLIVPGVGSWCLLGFIITTLELPPDAPERRSCGECGACVKACPGQALDGHGGLDSRRCRSYQTIEYRGDSLDQLSDRVYGCDVCQEVCPWNSHAPITEIAEFAPRPAILALSREDIMDMEQEEFSGLFRHSAIKRAKLAGLKRNALHCGSDVGHAGEPGNVVDAQV
ncbi:MAG: tRNA epoxyqueuosine(34) reductase QueG [Muribaculaceae bacterium]|nr:tRNA epoxyqueuosine(34) reductase QueG [Muribaculaceae bacterium]